MQFAAFIRNLILMCAALLPTIAASADQLPSYCGTIGAGRYPAPSINHEITIPIISLERGTPITVTSVSDVINGDVRTVSSLLQNPGADGISLREAITATNNDPGLYTIRFSPQMKGAVIMIGPGQLPTLQGGNVVLNGDIDGDGKPDVTLQNQVGTQNFSMGIVISSSEVVAHALALRDFYAGILIRPSGANQTYENIAVVNCLIVNPTSSAGGIILHPGWPEVTKSRNRWVGTTIMGNTIDGQGSGIDLMLHFSAGDRLEETIIVDNTVNNPSGEGNGIGLSAGHGAGSENNQIIDAVIARNHIEGDLNGGIVIAVGYGNVDSGGATLNLINRVRILSNQLRLARPDSFGIQLSAGFWVGSEGNQIADVLVAGNSLEGTMGMGIAVMSGAVGASQNLIHDIRVEENRLSLKAEAGGEFGVTSAIGIAALTGDGATNYSAPSFRPIAYPNDNRLEDVWITNNTIAGAGTAGIQLGAGNWGAKRNILRRVWVLGNVVTDSGFPPFTTNGIIFDAGSGVNETTKEATRDNRIADVAVFGNTLQFKEPNVFLLSGGVAIFGGGQGGRENTISGIQVAYNEVDPGGVLGINLAGGWSAIGEEASQENQLSRIECWCNTISTPPAPDVLSNLKGISVVGGMYGAKYNRLVNIHLADNLVAGILNDYSVVPNHGEDAIGNSIQLSDAAIVSPAFMVFPLSGGTGSINVITQTGRAWNSASNEPWITITSGSSGSGNGTVNYSVSAHTGINSRSGTVTIAGQTFAVTQSGSSGYAVAPMALYFPHVDTSLPWQTEIAVINTSDQTVTGTLRGMSNVGQLVVTNAVTLSARGRRQITVADEFTDHTDIGYIIFDTDSAAVQGYTKFYQAGKYRAAIPAVAVKEINASDIYISHIDSGAQWWTGVSLVNTTSATKQLTITFNTGQSMPYTLNANEHKAFMIGGLFNQPIQSDIKSAVITNASGVIGLELFGNIGGSDHLDGLLLTDKTASTIYYPHVENNGWWTGIVAYNPSDLPCTITITPYSAQGTALSPITRSLAGKEKYVGMVADLGLPAQTAWFKIDSTSAITGFELFGTADGNQLAAYAGRGGTGAKTGVFPKIEKYGWTGIAFVNTEAGAASVTLNAYNDAGNAVATQVLTVGGHAKEVKLAEAFFSQSIADATYIAYSSDRNVVGFQLNGSSDGTMLDGLPSLGGTN